MSIGPEYQKCWPTAQINAADFDAALETAHECGSRNQAWIQMRVARALRKRGNWSRRAEVVVAAKQASANENVGDYGSIVIEQVDAGEIDDALTTAGLIKDPGERAYELCSISNRVAKDGDDARSAEILAEAARALRLISSNEPQMQTEIGMSLARAHQFEAARQAAANGNDYIVEAIAVAYAEQGNVDAAAEEIKRVSSTEIRVSTAANIIEMLATAREDQRPHRLSQFGIIRLSSTERQRQRESCGSRQVRKILRDERRSRSRFSLGPRNV